jgi:hypothetical protein
VASQNIGCFVRDAPRRSGGRESDASLGIVCKGKRNPTPFGGDGRACGDCHVPGDNFGISVGRIADLPADSPLFFQGLDEDEALLRAHGLVHVVVASERDEFRQTPKLTHLKRTCSEDGACVALGLLGDRVPNLCTFTIQAIANHMSKTTARVPGQDFRSPDANECEALTAHTLSDLVAGQARRK